jgi:hypothetical protein
LVLASDNTPQLHFKQQSQIGWFHPNPTYTDYLFVEGTKNCNFVKILDLNGRILKK